MAIQKFTPQNSDQFLGKDQGDHSIGKFGHLNYLLKLVNAATLNFNPGSILFSNALGAPTADPTQLHWDDANNRLGIGNATPTEALDVTGSIKYSGTLYTPLTTGSVPFIGASGAVSQNNSKLFWDNTNSRLGVGTSTPTVGLEPFGGVNVGSINGTIPSTYRAAPVTTKLPQLTIEIATRVDAPDDRGYIRAGGWHTSTWFGVDAALSWQYNGGAESTQNTAFGFNAMKNATTANNCDAFGGWALSLLTTGTENSAFGRDSLGNLTTGTKNTSVGLVSGYDLTTGGFNTFVGNRTGRGITTGNYNTVVGASVSGLASTLSNTVILADGQGNRRLYVDNIGNAAFGSTSPAASAKLSVVSTTAGFLPPVMTGAQAVAIVSPAEGLMVYATSASGAITAKGWWGWDGSTWKQLG